VPRCNPEPCISAIPARRSRKAEGAAAPSSPYKKRRSPSTAEQIQPRPCPSSARCSQEVAGPLSFPATQPFFKDTTRCGCLRLAPVLYCFGGRPSEAVGRWCGRSVSTRSTCSRSLNGEPAAFFFGESF
jgi:hypothetical protein